MRRSVLLAGLTTVVVVTSAASATTMSGSSSLDRAAARLTLVAFLHGPNASTTTSAVVETNFHVELIARLAGIQLKSGDVLRIAARKVKPEPQPVKIVRSCTTTPCVATVGSQIAANWEFKAQLLLGGQYVKQSNIVNIVWYQKKPIALELSVNGKSARATTAKPTNDDPIPVIVPYGASLNIKADADKPMPTGWKIEVRHNGDVKSTGSGDYPVVCTTTTATCVVTRPPPTLAVSADFDDVVYAQIVSPDGVFRQVQILVYYRK